MGGVCDHSQRVWMPPFSSLGTGICGVSWPRVLMISPCTWSTWLRSITLSMISS